MDAKKLKKGETYYVLVGDNWYPCFGVVKAKYIGNAGWPYNSDLVFVEQDIDGVLHRFEADAGEMYPLNKKVLSAILHNMRQTRRVVEHDKGFSSKNAHEKITGWMATLPETDQKAMIARFREGYPHLVSKDGEFFASKFKRSQWNDLLGLYWIYKYPMVEVLEY